MKIKLNNLCRSVTNCLDGVFRVKRSGRRNYMDIILKLKEELNIEKWQAAAAVKLIDEENTITYI